jgi:predicted  nucleic acid-binding Zn-ribbon protein
MKIKRFFESDQLDISTERITEIMDELKDFIANIEDKSKMVDALGTELSNYRNSSTKSNDQIDDSIAALQIIKKDLDDCVDKLDTVVNNLDSYNVDGRKYLYTENK